MRRRGEGGWPGRRQRGVTLVELMIALVLGLLVTAAVYQVFVSNQQTYRMQQSLARIQENGRFALDTLAYDLRHAGYRGGYDAAGNLVIAEDGEGDLEGWEGGTGDLTLPRHVPATDVIALRYVDPSANPVTGAERHVVYYIGLDVDGIPALRRVELEGGGIRSDEALVDGVADMRIAYGIAGGDGALREYLDASQVGDWSRVQAVRISLLLRGEERNVMPEPVAIRMGNIDFAAEADDRRMYHAFTTTVALRNRLP